MSKETRWPTTNGGTQDQIDRLGVEVRSLREDVDALLKDFVPLLMALESFRSLREEMAGQEAGVHSKPAKKKRRRR